MSSSYGGVKKVVTARIVSATEIFQELSGGLIENHGYF